MAPSPSTRTLKELPHHLLYQVIMPKLPFKTINRFKCISKEINMLITEDAQFAADQVRSADASSSGFVCMHWNRLSFFPDTALIGVPDPFLEFLKAIQWWSTQIVSSTNGLLLLYGKFDGIMTLCVSNPATKEMELVPYDKRERLYRLEMGLAFDPSKSPNCYTIVDPVLHYKGKGLLFSFDIFRSETGKWTRSPQSVHVRSAFNIASPLYANGVIYWHCSGRDTTYLLWYDTKRDVAGSMPFPVIGGNINLGVYAEEVMYYRAWTDGIEVWRLTNGCNWDKLHSTNWDCVVDAFECCHGMRLRHTSQSEMFFKRRFVRPVGFEGRFFYIVVRMRRQDVTGRLFSWDLETGRVQLKSCVPMNRVIFNYTNSLVRVPQVLKGAS